MIPVCIRKVKIPNPSNIIFPPQQVLTSHSCVVPLTRLVGYWATIWILVTEGQTWCAGGKRPGTLCILSSRWPNSSRFVMISPAGRRREEFGFTWRNQFSGIFFLPFFPPSLSSSSSSFYCVCIISPFYSASRGFRGWILLLSTFPSCLQAKSAWSLWLLERSSPSLPTEQESVYIPGDGEVAGPSQSVCYKRAGTQQHHSCLFVFFFLFLQVSCATAAIIS